MTILTLLSVKTSFYSFPLRHSVLLSNGKSWLYWDLESNWNSCNSQRVDKNYPNFQSCSKGTAFLLKVYLSPIDKKLDIFRLTFFLAYNFAKCTIQAQYAFFPPWCNSASWVHRKYEDIRYFAINIFHSVLHATWSE